MKVIFEPMRLSVFSRLNRNFV